MKPKGKKRSRVITDPKKLVAWIISMLEDGYEISVSLGR